MRSSWVSSPPYGQGRSSSRRFLPPDPKVHEPYRLTPGLAVRVGILGGIALIVFGTLFFRLWSLQILSSPSYLAAAQDNQLRTFRVEAQRGPVLDRDNRVIVDNTPGTAVQLWVGDLPKQNRYREIQRLAAVLNVPVLELASDVDAHRNQLADPITVKTGVTYDQVAYLTEHRLDFPGIQIASTYLRHYRYQTLAAQILGYVGEISPQQLKKLGRERYAQGEAIYHAGDKIGQTGVESAFDRFLRGRPGRAQIRVDSLGQPRSGPQMSRREQPGYAIKLTIDIQLQRAAEKALRDGIAIARQNGQWAANGGAVVAIDPRDGAVLAMASYPTYKPSLFAGRIEAKKVAPLLNESAAKAANYPGVDKATLGLTRRARSGSRSRRWRRCRSTSSRRTSRSSARRRRRTGGTTSSSRTGTARSTSPMTLTEALAESCDTYFYAVGDRFYQRGPGNRLGAAPRSGRSGSALVARRVSTSAVRRPGWCPHRRGGKRLLLSKKGYTSWDRAWKPGDSILLAIGQKDIHVTPLQMARFYALSQTAASS